MSKNIPKHFVKFYEQCCRENNTKSKLHLLENKHLKINADHLEKNDWTPVIKALQNFSTDLHSIIIYSTHLKKYRKLDSAKSKESASNMEPAFLKEPLLKLLIETVAKAIINSEILCTLSLESFPLDNHLELLCNSIRDQHHLQHLGFPHCKLSDMELTLLCRIIAIHTGLLTVNLTGCGITSEGAKQIATLIRSQKLVRYGETWKQSLRYRLPQPDIVPGLRRLTLNDNPGIGDKGFEVITYEIFDDMWIRAIDFQNCGITKRSSEIVIDLIEKNPVLKILDLRRNNVPCDMVNDIMSMLKFRKDEDGSDTETYEWMNSTVTSYSTIVNQKQKVRLSKNTNSALNLKENISVITQSFSQNKDFNITRSLNNLGDKTKILDNEKDNRARQGYSAQGELERTKNILHRVSTKLFEERNKREALQKQQKEYQEQLEEIRSCLKHHEKISQSNVTNLKANSKPSLRNKRLHTKSLTKQCEKCKMTDRNKYASSEVVHKNTKKKNKNVDARSYMSNNSNCTTSQSLKPTKLFLVIPKSNQKKHSKYVNLLDDKKKTVM